MNDTEKLEKVCEGIDYIYHLGAIADIDVCINKPYDTFQVNVLGTINLLEAARKNSVKRVLFSSSIYVHSRSGSFYKISKHACEQLLEEYSDLYGLDYTVLRFGTLYGQRSDKHNSVYRYLKSALENREMIFRGTGEESREYVHVKDSARICVKALEDEFSGENLIITGHHRMKVLDLLKMIQEILGNDVKITHNSDNIESHYMQTPFSYHPKIGKKIVSSTYCDLGQSLIEILEEIDERPSETIKI